MAIVYDSASNSGYQTAQSSYSWSHNAIANEIDNVLIVAVSMLSVAGNQVTGITYDGNALTKVRSDTSASTVVRSELWYLVNPPIGTKTIVVTLSTATDSVAGAFSLHNVFQGNPIDNSNGTTGINLTDDSIYVNLTTKTRNTFVLGVIATSDTSFTAGGYIQQWQISGALGRADGGYFGAQVAIGTVSVMETDADVTGTWTVSALSLLPSGSTPGNKYRNITVGNGMSSSEGST